MMLVAELGDSGSGRGLAQDSRSARVIGRTSRITAGFLGRPMFISVAHSPGQGRNEVSVVAWRCSAKASWCRRFRSDQDGRRGSDLVKGNPRHPRREILRTKVRESPKHRPRGLANIHDFAAIEEDKTPPRRHSEISAKSSSFILPLWHNPRECQAPRILM